MDASALPSGSELWKAIDIYLQHAYPASHPTPTVQHRLDQLRSAGDHPWESPAIEKTVDNSHTVYGVRLGNSWYPHMKLAAEPSPDGTGYMLRVDTHDRHIRPAPQSREFDAFLAMQQRNSALAAEIESAWAQQSLMTFKEFLRRDLEQRTGEAATDPI